MKEEKLTADFRSSSTTGSLISSSTRLSEVITQHRSYTTHSTQDNLRYNKVRNSGLTELRDPRYMISPFPQKIHPLQGTPIPNFKEKSGMASIYSVDSRTSCSPLEFHCATIKTASKCQRIIAHTVTLSSPSPVLSCVESVPQGAHVSHIPVADSEHGQSKSYTEASTSQVLRDVHISTRLMEEFLELAKENTDKDLETCGILGAFLERGTFYVTTLIIPKQESTSSSCQAINEVEVFAIQNERSLLPVGWIHTHPSQSCFMSSVDLHTQYSYQVMVPEAFAIVMAPTDTSRSYGIFRVSDPGGMSVLKECQENGFHPHKEVADGSPIYEQCSYVYKNSNLRFEIFDLR